MTPHKRLQFVYIFALSLGVLFSTHSLFAASNTTDLEIAGWIPYFSETTGVPDAMQHLDDLDTIHPFGYSVKDDGTLTDLMGVHDDLWDNLIDEAQDRDVEVIPTIIWNNGAAIHAILSDENKREDHIDEIVDMVKENRFDGVDIDYEGKLAATYDYFADFLKELNSRLGSRYELVCTIEARTPPTSLYRVVPANLEYANDYQAIGTYCDRVQIMAYDQERADLLLNDAKHGAPYMPIADVDWVRKVAELATQTIPKEKIMLGVPTYGTEYEVTVSPNWFQNYRQIWSVSPVYGSMAATNLHIPASRNKAGELSVSYPNMMTPIFPGTLVIPSDTPTGQLVSAKALAYANQTGKTLTFNMIWWSDAEAIKQKVDLAKELGLRGIVMWKIDGSEDPNTWNILQ